MFQRLFIGAALILLALTATSQGDSAFLRVTFENRDSSLNPTFLAHITFGSKFGRPISIFAETSPRQFQCGLGATTAIIQKVEDSCYIGISSICDVLSAPATINQRTMKQGDSLSYTFDIGYRFNKKELRNKSFVFYGNYRLKVYHDYFVGGILKRIGTDWMYLNFPLPVSLP